MTITEKYNFKVSVNQFNGEVDFNYFDKGELHVIEVFEKEALRLSLENKPLYSMIELGSAQAYYSLLFKHILGKDKTLNIMVEPIPWRCEMGKKEFELNNCEGRFYNCGVGKSVMWNQQIVDVDNVTIDSLLAINGLHDLDFLHCDIDGNEWAMLQENKELFEKGKIKWLFLYTHESLVREGFHDECKNFFSELKYELIYEWRWKDNKNCIITDDSLVYRKHL